MRDYGLSALRLLCHVLPHRFQYVDEWLGKIQAERCSRCGLTRFGSFAGVRREN